MPRENNRIYEKTLASSDNLEKNVNFFCEIGKVKNTEYSTNNWIRAVELFRAKNNYEKKLEEISETKVLDSQLAQYLAAMKQQNGNEYSISSIKAAVSAIYRYLNQNSVISNCNLYDNKIYKQFWQVYSGKIKYLTDLGYGEKNGSNGLSNEEVQNILNHSLMDGSTPQSLLKKVFFYNAILLGLHGGEHFYLMAENFKKREDGGFDILIYRSKTNQRVEIGNRGKADKLILPNNPDIIGVYENISLYTGCWYERIHVGQNRLKSFMNEICKMCGIDCTNRKITNHTGHKTLVQGLQKLGFSRDSMKLATRHKNVESLDSYELPREQEQIGMINNLVDNIQCTKRKQEESDANTFDIDNNYKMKKNKGFVTAKEG
ncbi:zinc finger MYM-type protein 2-like [Rhizophagus irregularis DAOM 181602=DAOM 197198]|nr:zinc finger MYM-type protein 2-like [Rhizophagus irregularis DAOM 181602=DAOM 197198]